MKSLVLLSAVMAAVTLAAGWLPLLLPQAVDTSLLSPFGSGIILGSAFLLIIPESYEQLEGPLTPVAGFSVVAGFLLMLAVDSVLFGPGSRGGTQGSGPNADEGASLGTAEPCGDESETYFVTRPAAVSLADVRSWFAGISFTTLGLTIHAAADGVALGSTAGSTSSRLKLLVFLSIIVHKAPAAFSLTSILLASKPAPSLRQIQRDVILFSLAGPVLAVVLGGFLALLHLKSGLRLIPGVCLAFSGGTFLFVATHVLEHARLRRGQWKQLGLIFAGTGLPLIASLLPE